MSDASRGSSDTVRSRALARKLLTSLLVGALFLWLLRAGALPIVPNEAISRTSPLLVSTSVLGYMAALTVRALRWQRLVASVERVSALHVAQVALVGFAAIVLFPLRTGEAVRPMLARRAGVNPWTATGTVGAERIVDGLFVSLVLLGSLAVAPPRIPSTDEAAALGIGPAGISTVARTAALLFAAASAGVVLVFKMPSLPRRILSATVGRFYPKLVDQIVERIDLVVSALGLVTRLRTLAPFVCLTALYWGLSALSLWGLARSVGFHDLPLVACATLLGVLALGIIPPGGPGMFGTFQFALYAGLFLYYPMARLETEGSVFVFLAYVVQIGVLVAGGALGFIGLYLLDPKRRPIAG